MLGLNSGDRTAIIGCGGKTSLMYKLAAEKRAESVLMTTTTHIFRPPAYVYDFEPHGFPEHVTAGIYLYCGGEKDGKLSALPEDELAHMQSLFDNVFIEADGSNSRPLKGWLKTEPVIPDFADATIGVVSVSPVGEALSEKNAHRLPLFCEITGAALGGGITAAHIASMISHPYGMFKSYKGKRILFINQVESQSDREHALKIFTNLPKPFLHTLSRLIIGSLKQNEYEIIWEDSNEPSKHT